MRNAIFLNASYVGFKRINGYADVFEIQLPKLRNRVSGKRMHPHAPQTRVRKYVCQAIRSPVDAPRRYKWDSPWYTYTRFVQYHQENVAEGNLWKYGENNERTVARENIWTFRLKLLTNILRVLYKIFRDFISTITRHDHRDYIDKICNLITWVTYCKDILSKKNQCKINKKYSMKFEKVSCKARNVFIQFFCTFVGHFMTCNVAQENSKSRKYHLSS